MSERLIRKWEIKKVTKFLHSYYTYEIVHCRSELGTRNGRQCIWCLTSIPEKYIKLRNILNFMSKL